MKTIRVFHHYFFYKVGLFVGLLMCVTLFGFSVDDVIAKDTVTNEKVMTPIKDVRILIDISGSMKKTDPNNLRRPAVKLFASLLPENVYSGVWTFGKWVNMLIPYGMADKKWKSIANKQAKNINSAGLFTNIEEALRRATWDWKEYNPEYDRTIIILSDGVVDVSSNPQENMESRNRILTDILTRLTNAKVKIHTIALSSLSDKSLLQQLSFVTNGIHETIETTTDLDKVFMRIFDVATPRDELPLIDNKVKVDKSIKEITFLAFRKNKSSKTVIISPSGNRYDSKITNNDTTWHSEKRYDLITINKPESGTWSIDADINPDNRVLVVTDLRLVVSHLPDNLLLNQSAMISAHLESEGKIIENRDFLHFVRMKLKRSSDDDEPYTSKLKDNGKGIDKHKKDGVFSAEIKDVKLSGKYNFELSVNGTTFKRRKSQQINFVKYPVSVNINTTEKNNIIVRVIPHQSLIDPVSMKITTTHVQPDGDNEKYAIKKTGPIEWSITIPTNNISGKHGVTIHANGKNRNDEEINIDTDIVSVIIGDENSEKHINPEEKTDTSAVENIDDDEHTSWTLTLLIVLIFNIIAGILGFIVYKLWEKFRYKLIPHPCEEMTNA